MSGELKQFKIKQKFKGSEELYAFILKNADKVSKIMGIQIQSPKNRVFCLTAKEKITEKNVVLIASENEYPQSLADLVLLGGAFNADIVIFFIEKTTVTYMESFQWLQKISNNDTQFIVGEVSYNKNH